MTERPAHLLVALTLKAGHGDAAFFQLYSKPVLPYTFIYLAFCMLEGLVNIELYEILAKNHMHVS